MIAFILPAVVGAVIGQTYSSWSAAGSRTRWRQLESNKTIFTIFTIAVLSVLVLNSGVVVFSHLGLDAFASKSIPHAIWGCAGVITLLFGLSNGISTGITKAHAWRDQEPSQSLKYVVSEGAELAPSPFQKDLEAIYVWQAFSSFAIAICGCSPLIYLILAALQLTSACLMGKRTFVRFTDSDNTSRVHAGGAGGIASHFKVIYFAEVFFPKDPPSSQEEGGRGLTVNQDPVSPVQFLYEEIREGKPVESRDSRERVSEISQKVRTLFDKVLQSTKDSICSKVTLRRGRYGQYEGDNVTLRAEVPKLHIPRSKESLYVLQMQATLEYRHNRAPEGKKMTDHPVDITWTENLPA